MIQPDWQKLRSRYLMICTPTRWDFDAPYVASLLDTIEMCKNKGIHCMFQKGVGDSLITRARNLLFHTFMHSPATHALFIDSDIQWEPEDVLTLLQLDLPIAGAVYSKHNIFWENIVKAVQKGIPVEKLPEICGEPNLNWLPGNYRTDEPMPVKHLATGFMMVRKDVLQKLATLPIDYNPCAQERAAMGDVKLHEFFPVGIDTQSREYVSEDWAFCQLCQNQGFQIYALPWIRLVHYGRFPFVCCLKTMIESGLVGDAQAT